MKRLIIAVIILAGVAVVSILSLNVQLSNTEYLLGELEEIQQAYDEGNRRAVSHPVDGISVKTFRKPDPYLPAFHASCGYRRYTGIGSTASGDAP